MAVVRIGMGQLNTRVGDFGGNVGKIVKTIKDAGSKGVELLVFPEMSVSGYPPRDLLFRGSFLKACRNAMEEVAKATARRNTIVVLGGVDCSDVLYNAATVIQKGKVIGIARKRYLFCCGNFDETRYFSAGERPLVIETDRFKAAVTLGDDFGYPVFPAEIELLINLWNEPYHYGHRPLKEQLMRERAREDAVAIAMVGPVGGQDEMVFEGGSTLLDGYGEVIARGAAFKEDLVIADLDLRQLKVHRERVFHTSRPKTNHMDKVDKVRVDMEFKEEKKPLKIKKHVKPLLRGPEEVFTALVTATGDFVKKNGCKGVVVGVSGGIDSALTAAIAKEALGPKKVTALSMPGPHTSRETRADAKKLAQNLGVKFIEIPITKSYNSMLSTLGKAFTGTEPDVTEENLQARLRGVTLMAMANKFGAMVLATGNKSEAATGYCTLYGDTAGGYAPLADVYKTHVYDIALWYNEKKKTELIPESVIDRVPSAELKPDQTDQDVLPPYEDLDRILHAFLEGGWSLSELEERGEDPALLAKVMSMVTAVDFKRKQMPLGPAVSERPLTELRWPITKSTGWWFDKRKKTRKKRNTAKKKKS